MDIPEVGTKFRHKDYPRKVFAFMSENRKGDVVWWTFIDVASGKARYFHVDEVIEIEDKRTSKPRVNKSASKERVQKAAPEPKPQLKGDEKVISVGGDDVTVI